MTLRALRVRLGVLSPGYHRAMGLMITIIVLCVLIGVPGTLLWWRIADKWADSEHKRFPEKPTPSDRPAPTATVVDFDTPTRK